MELKKLKNENDKIIKNKKTKSENKNKNLRWKGEKKQKFPLII